METDRQTHKNRHRHRETHRYTLKQEHIETEIYRKTETQKHTQTESEIHTKTHKQRLNNQMNQLIFVLWIFNSRRHIKYDIPVCQM